jgi:hypothetical protein
MDSLPNQLGYLLLDEDGAVIAVSIKQRYLGMKHLPTINWHLKFV